MASSESKGIFDIIIGAALIAASFFVPVAGPLLAQAGAGMIITGVGTLIAGNHNNGFATTIRNPIQPRHVHYGFGRVGGTMAYMNLWGSSDQMLDLVIVLATHPCQGGDLSYQLKPDGSNNTALGTNLIPELLFNQQRVQIDRSKAPFAVYRTAGTSFAPAQQINVLVYSFVRVGSVCTIVLKNDIPYLSPGDKIKIHNLPPGTGNIGLTGNGIWQVQQIVGRGGGFYGVTFTVLSGGPAINIFNFSVGVGYADTLWASFGNKVYIEVLTGNQSLNQTFAANAYGSPWDGDTGNFISPSNPKGLGGNNSLSQDPWQAACSLQGMTAVFLRLHYDQTIFSGGLPQISFILYGKNDIYDPRLGSYGSSGTRAYTTNSALCVADFLSQGAPLGAPWSSSTTYSAGAVVSYITGNGGVGVDYISLINSNTNNQPDTNTTDWAPVTPTTFSLGGWVPAQTYSKGQMVTYIGNSTSSSVANVQYVCLTTSTGNDPSLSPTYWAALSIPVRSVLKYGYSLNYGTDIPLTSLTSSANICDQTVALIEGGTESMYTCNGGFDLDMRRGEILQNLLTSCSGRLSILDGQYFIQPGYWAGPGSPPTTITLAPICAGPVKWKSAPTVRELYNGVKGTYISPANNWQSADIPPYAQDYLHGYNGPAQYQGDVNLATDGGDRRWLDVHLPFTISPSMAQRIAKIELLRRRYYQTGTFILTLSAYQLVPLDIIEATFPFLSFSGKYLEVSAVRFTTVKPPAGSGGSGDGAPALAIEIDFQTTDSSIYAWNDLEELTPQGYQQGVPPTEVVNETVPLPWSPGHVTISATDYYNSLQHGDAYYTYDSTSMGYPIGPASFAAVPVYSTDNSGNPVITVQVLGHPPINSLAGIYGPQISATGSTTGGSLPAGSYIVGMSAFNAGSLPYSNSPYLDYALVTIPATSPPTSTGSISVDIFWSVGDIEGDIYLALQSLTPQQGNQLKVLQEWDSRAVMHFNQNISSTSTTSATITTFDQSQPGGPDTVFDHFSVTWVPVIHSGVWAQQVQAVTATTVTVADPNGNTTSNQYAGYVLSLLGKQTFGIPVPVLNMPVASNTSSGGSPPAAQIVFTIGANAAGNTLPDLRTFISVGDLVVMRSNGTFTSTSVTDTNWANSYYPSGASGIESNHAILMLGGPDAGDIQQIASVSGTNNITLNLVNQFQVTPNPGDPYIVISQDQPTEWNCPPVSNPNKTVGPQIIAQPSVPNFVAQTWLFTVRTKTNKNAYCPDFLAPCRDLYLFGTQGTRTVTSTGSQLSTDRILLFDTSSISTTTLTLSSAITAGDTTIHLSGNYTPPNNTYLNVRSDGTHAAELFFVTGGSGTSTVTVSNAAARNHNNGTTVDVPGGLVFTLLTAVTQAPNQNLYCHKVSTDISYAIIEDPAGNNYVLADTSQQYGSISFVAPAQ